ncbi:ATPase [Acidovorax phage ACP17]|uniref:Uncharacterized protein n=1 Tax=Acidovorax phage ACP17 TaxID=2010329 RepID=A0A218M380_9CAUD|nr:ATPase [Acidovorax phage ACP17]ASD50504.1 hypothetical protein [Acidovorax phage ACP17]
MDETTLTIFRGLPGSGKSTLAKKICPRVYEADQFFLGLDGSYRFDPEMVSRAHRWCAKSVYAALAQRQTVGVANTNTTIAEVMRYAEMGVEAGVRIAVYELTGSYGSVHNVPDLAMERMRDRWVDGTTIADTFNAYYPHYTNFVYARVSR